MARNDPLTFEAVFLRENDNKKSVLVAVGRQQAWIPNSQIHDDSDIYVGCTRGAGEVCTLVIPRWLAEDRGFVAREEDDDIDEIEED